MLGITEWRDYITRLAEASENIRHSMLVVDVAHLKERLKELDYSLDFPLLVGVIPTAYASTTLDEDNISELNVCMLFVLSPLTTDGSDAEIESYVITHNAIVDIKRTMREDYFNCEAYPLLRDIKFKSYVQDPEWDVLGLMGWRLGFEIETGEYASGEPLPPVPPQPPIPPTYSELTYEYTADGLVLILSVKNNYEESGTFIIYFKTDEEDYVMLNAWVNSKETYVFRTLARETNNLVSHKARAFDYQTIQIRQITIPATPFISYSDPTAEHADDADYNDIIRCSITAKNDSLISQLCTIYFKLGKYLVQQTFLIPALTSHIFTCDFENVDIFVENTVTFHNSAMQVVSTVTIAATPEFEMFFDAKAGNMTANFYFSAKDFCNVLWGDGTTDEIIVTGGYAQYSGVYSHTYSTEGLKRITFSNPQSIIMFRIIEPGVDAEQYYISDISQYYLHLEKQQKT